MAAWVIHPQKIKFIHVPKAAGSAVTKWAMGNFDMQKLGPATHYSLLQTNEIAPETKDYFSFCVVRNTYDRLVSLYEFSEFKAHKTLAKLKKKGKIGRDDFWLERIEHYKLGFKKWLDTSTCRDEPDQLTYIFDDDGNQISYIIRYENFKEEFKLIQEKLNSTVDPTPANVRPNSTPYPEYYDAEAIEKVAKLFKNEINYFGFTFE